MDASCLNTARIKLCVCYVNLVVRCMLTDSIRLTLMIDLGYLASVHDEINKSVYSENSARSAKTADGRTLEVLNKTRMRCVNR